MSKKIQLKIRELDKKVQAIRPQQSVGSQFTRTGRGTMIRTTATSTTPQTETAQYAKWG